MQTIDFAPLFRNSVGFDRMRRLLDASARMEPSANAYPPYNIVQSGEDTYRITMAVAGFSEQDLDITAKENTLIISGKIAESAEEKLFLHRGIAGRAFERRFDLEDHIKVVGAGLVNGLLNIELEREVPEESRPRKISIDTHEPKRVEKKAA
ncbi:MAG: Hsp20 family protein [Proteobacteria bacterium]|nr:Hsp20 family protein [Pseudomonadota bacterium]